MAGPKKTPRDGSAFIMGLLLVCLVLVAALAWQAVDAALSHRAAAEAALRDYARLAADEFVRRSVSEIGFYGYYRALTALGRYRRSHTGALPGREALIASDERNERALSLVRYFFLVEPATGRLETAAGPAPGEAVERWLRGELPMPQAGADEGAMQVVQATIAGEARSFAFVAGEGDPATLLGFEVETASLGGWFEEVLERRPLLPPSVSEGVDDLEFLVLSVRDASYREIFRYARPGPGERPDPYLFAGVPFGDGYEGILEGLEARVTLYPSAASKLVIGGLPGTRLPMLLGLLVLTVGLLLAAIFQLRRARALAQLRSDFVSRVSHELRTPLTQIRMFAETLLLGRVRSEQERRRSLEIIDQEARRLGHLVENILQFSRSERDTVRLEPEPRELAPLLREWVRDFAPLVGGRKVSFAIHPVAAVTVAVDEDAMRQILLNLLDNAVKYGPPEQQILIGLEAGADGWVRLSVDDEGPGIPARDRHRIWRSFQRLERDRRSAVAGTGIGLAVVHDLVALQGGRIRVEEGSRGGARFVLELPLVAGPSRAGADDAEEVPA